MRGKIVPNRGKGLNSSLASQRACVQESTIGNSGVAHHATGVLGMKRRWKQSDPPPTVLEDEGKILETVSMVGKKTARMKKGRLVG
ncbi:MAG: hypothetical protein KatS3mg123_2949 [Burkholderiales bacterium]|nr:MAG: hypothetical protein KatS3mg123_2949 [Burkholderiales bacterium]